MKIKKILLGTSNPAKAAEWKKLFNQEISGVEVSLVGKLPEPEETGETYEENASQKAVHFAKLTGEYVFGDDGGFEIDAFGGAPGVKSKRILPGGGEASYEEQVNYVLEKTRDLPESKRGARLTSAIALSDPKGKIIYLDRESFEGVIPTKASKVDEEGYPYRRLLYVPSLSKNYTELSTQEYKKLSHKRKIARRLAKFLKNG